MTVTLAATEQGDGPPVVILHGLFGSARNLSSVARRLAASHRVIALDLRNHGESPWAETMDYDEMAADVLAALDARGIDAAALLGHSMGGKVAMAAALRWPERVGRLVVVDIAPVAYPPAFEPYVAAMRRADLGTGRRAAVDAALTDAIPDPMIRQFLMQNLTIADGRAAWRINLAAIERALPALSDFRPPEDGRYDGPALFVAGGRSDYVGPEQEPRIRRLFPAATITRIPEAGHWVHAERPDALLAAVAPFLDA
jgi:esterase